jgi:hypothetical protein
MGAIIFPIAVVILAINQCFVSVRFSLNTYLILAVLSGFCCTLCVCLSTHFFVASETRRGAVAVQVAIGLIVLWGGFFYFVMQSEAFSALVDGFHVMSERGSQQFPGKTEIRNGVGWIVPCNSACENSYLSPISTAIGTAIFAIIVAPYLISWALVNLPVSARFRILISMMCVSWVVAGIAWSFGPNFDTEAKTKALVPIPATQQDNFEVPVPQPTSSDEVISSRWYLDSLPSLAIGMLFAIPAYLSIPFAQLFLQTFADTNQLAKTWIITTLASLLMVVLMAIVAPRIFPNQAVSLATAGLALSLLSAWVILPTVTDSATTWVAGHVCRLTWMIAGFILLGRPWAMSHDQLLRHLALLSPPIMLTLLHLLLGLYGPKTLGLLKNLSWWILQGFVGAMAVTAYFAPALCIKLVSPFFWTTVFIGPYASTPSEISYLYHAAVRRTHVPGVMMRLRGLLRRTELNPDSSLPPRTQLSTFEAIDPDIRASFPEADTVRYAVRLHKSEWFDALALIMVIVATTASAVSYGFLRHRSAEALRDNWLWFTGTVVLVLFAGWLLLKRQHLSRQTLVLGNNTLGWWNGSQFEWMTEYSSVRDVQVWSQRVKLVTHDGNQITTRALDTIGAWAASAFIQRLNLKLKFQSAMESLDRDGVTDIGPLRLSWQGLTINRNTLLWREVESVSVTMNGVFISRRGGPKHWRIIPARKIVNPLCLRTLVYFFNGTQIFLSEITGVSNVSPEDFDRVCRSARGMDEFRLSDEQHLVKAMTRVFALQFPWAISTDLELDSALRSFPDEDSPELLAAGESWREIARRISLSVRIPEPLEFLVLPTENVWAHAMKVFVQEEAAIQIPRP